MVRNAFADRSWLLHELFYLRFPHRFFGDPSADGSGFVRAAAERGVVVAGVIGMANVAGSLLVGWGVGRYRSKWLLFGCTVRDRLLIVWYLMMPRTDWTFYIFAVGLGLTWLATVPPTAAIVGKLFGTRYLATLFGPNFTQLPNRRFSRRLSRRAGDFSFWRLRLDVVRRYGAGRHSCAAGFADSRKKLKKQ